MQIILPAIIANPKMERKNAPVWESNPLERAISTMKMLSAKMKLDIIILLKQAARKAFFLNRDKFKVFKNVSLSLFTATGWIRDINKVNAMTIGQLFSKIPPKIRNVPRQPNSAIKVLPI